MEVTIRVSCRHFVAWTISGAGQKKSRPWLFFLKVTFFSTVITLSPDCRVSLIRKGHLGVKHIEMNEREREREERKTERERSFGLK